LSEKEIPSSSSTDQYPNWIGDDVYFTSDRIFITNVFAYQSATGSVKQITEITKGDIKWLSGM
jgi:tricorn protease